MTSAVATAESLRVGRARWRPASAPGSAGILKLDTLTFDPTLLEFTAATASGAGAVVLAPVARLSPGTGRGYTAEASGWLFDSPVSARGEFDLEAKTADVAFDGSFAPALLDPLAARTKAPLRRFADFSQPIAIAGRVRFAPGWKFAGAQARVDARNILAYRVKFDEARGDVTYDGTHFAAREATIVSGDNLARGSYEQNFSTQEFRYLLEGRLRPLDITPWFGAGGWWTGLFKGFAFPSGAARRDGRRAGPLLPWPLVSRFSATRIRRSPACWASRSTACGPASSSTRPPARALRSPPTRAPEPRRAPSS